MQKQSIKIKSLTKQIVKVLKTLCTVSGPYQFVNYLLSTHYVHTLEIKGVQEAKFQLSFNRGSLNLMSMIWII